MNTPDKITQIKAAITAFFAVLTTLWGWVGWLVCIWALCLILDYASGTWAAKRGGTWASSIARDGLWHKLGEIVAVLVAALCDIALKIVLEKAGVSFDISALGGIEISVLTPIVLMWYILTELGSIMENAGKLGAPIPEWLTKGIETLKNETNKKMESQTGVEAAPETKPKE